MRCFCCGNEIPSWAGGVCYTCGRIRREERRYGAHPSAYRRARSGIDGPQLSPASVDRGSEFAEPSWVTSSEPRVPPDHCPVCGQGVPQDKLEGHIKLHTRQQRSDPPPSSIPMSQFSLDGCPLAPDGPGLPHSTGRMSAVTPLQVRRLAINRLLADIYGKKYFLSDILRAGGIDQGAIAQIREKRLTEFFDELLLAWRVAFASKLLPGAWHVMTRCYGLDGVTPPPAHELAQELNVPLERVSEVRQHTLSVLTALPSRSHLECTTVAVARRQLGYA